MSHVGTTVDLPSFAAKYTWILYDPNNFAAASLRFVKPDIAARLFSSGIIIFASSKNPYASIYVLLHIIDMLHNAGFPNARANPITTQNITCSVDLGGYACLQACHSANPMITSYVPEFFSGLRLSPEVIGIGSIAHTLYTTGKLLITGAKSTQQVLDSVNQFYSLYEPFITPHGTELAIQTEAEASIARKRTTVKRLKKTKHVEYEFDEEVEGLL